MKIENDKYSNNIPKESSFNYEAANWKKFKEKISSDIETLDLESNTPGIDSFSTELMKIVKETANNSKV